MPDIDDKISALAFQKTTQKSAEQIAQLVSDAAELAAATGGKIVITRSASGFTGVVKNFARVQHGVFTVNVAATPGGSGSNVKFSVDDYLRVRDTVLGFIPVSPWGAPAYKPLRDFAQRVQQQL